jgi:hypothetical protein
MSERYKFDSEDFTPNATKTLENMKFGGITLCECVLELIDNSEDAQAIQTHVYLEKDDDGNLQGLAVFDNGTGMTLSQLCNAVKLPGTDIDRKDGCIGKFGTGLKNATIGLGSIIYIVTKRENKYYAIYLDIEKMRLRNTFKPTAFWDDINIITSHIDLPIWNNFDNNTNGTLIYVKNIYSHRSTNIIALSELIINSITTGYSGLNSNINIYHVDNLQNIVDTIPLKLIDIFYRTQPNGNIVENCNVSTTLLIYHDKTIIEELTMKRPIGQNKFVNDKHIETLYFMFKPFNDKIKKPMCPFKDNHILLKNTDPDYIKYIIDGIPKGIIKLNCCLVTQERYKNELQDHNCSLRTGIFITRGKRIVAKALRLNMKLDDHYNRIRMNVSYPPLLDLEFGCRTQKQITDLNSIELSNALEIVFKQISSCYKQIAKNDIDNDYDSDSGSNTPKKKQEISGHELKTLLERIIAKIDSDKIYSDDYYKLYKCGAKI